MSGVMTNQEIQRRKVTVEDRKDIYALMEKAGLHGTLTYVERLGGMTNRTFHIVLDTMNNYVLRFPGEGTEELINRKDEEISTKLACALHIDADLYYFDDEGHKVSEWIQDAHTMLAEDLRQPEQIHNVAKLLSILHESGESTGIPFEVFDMAADYERIIIKNKVKLYADYEQIKAQVMSLKNTMDGEVSRRRVPCHNDPLCANWIYGNDRLYLIDWEYAGMNDPMWDLADVSIEAHYGDKEDAMLLEAYFGRPVHKIEQKSFLANKIYLDYLWTLWGLTRVPYDGQVLQDYADIRYRRLKQNLKRLQK